MVTIKEVAALAGVSTATVSRVLNGQGGAAPARARVMDAVQQLGYRPNGVARSLRQSGTRTLGLVISDLLNPFFTELARAVEDEARAFGLSLIIGNADERAEQLDHYVEVLLQRQVDGLLAVPTADQSPLLDEAVRRGAPLVLIDRDLPGADVPVVRSDSVPAVHELVDHLVRLGHRRIAIIAGPQRLVTGHERLTAFRDALDGHGLALPDAYVRVGDFQQVSGSVATAELLDLPQPPSVIFAADDLMGLGAMHEIRRRRLVVPDEIALAVFDDSPWFPLVDPPITAIAQRTDEMGRVAVRQLLARMAGDPAESRLLPCRLIVRSSCGARRGSHDE